MYGMNSSLPATATGLAYTGLNAGAAVLTAIGLFLMGVALIALVWPNGKVRP